MESGELQRQPQTTRLIIEPSSNMIGNRVDTGKKFLIKGITLGRSNREGSISYYRLSDMSKTTSVEVLMRAGERLENVSLPENILKNIAQYLRENPSEKGSFDCFSFVHYVNGIPYVFGEFRFKPWDIRHLTHTKNLNPGDTIFIAKSRWPKNTDITHFGIYLNNGLFISKFGDLGKLIVTDLEQMKKAFGGRHIFQARPKEVLGAKV